MKINDTEILKDGELELPVDEFKEAAHRDLAAGVLKQATQDLRRFHGATSTIERELYLDAYRWLTVDECSSPFSFLNVCQVLKLAPEEVRLEIIGDLSSNAFSYWKRRCERAANRLQISFSQFFTDRNASETGSIGRAETRDLAFHSPASLRGAC